MKSYIAIASLLAVTAFATPSFASVWQFRGSTPSSSTANNSVGSSAAGGGSMINPGGVERPKNSDVYPMTTPGTSATMRSESGRNPMQNSTLGSSSTAPRGDSR
ncbi:MAG: hypothetical protein WDO24_30390 [Pseudomonadota bacterium]